MLTVQEQLKYRITEGKYQRFMGWMGNALMGIPNTVALAFEVVDVDAARGFFGALLPGARHLTRIASRKSCTDNVVIYYGRTPRTHRQREAIRETMRRCSVLFVNPPRNFVNYTTLPCAAAGIFLDPYTLEHVRELAAMIMKYHMLLSPERVIRIHDTFQEAEDNELSFDALVERNPTPFRELAAFATIVGEAEFDFKDSRVTFARHPERPEASLLRLFCESYDNGNILFQWFVRTYMGMLMGNTILVVEDRTPQTLEWIRRAFKDVRIAILGDANVSSLYNISNFSDYKLFVFDRLTLPLIDLELLTRTSNVIMIDGSCHQVSFDPRVHHLRVRKTRDMDLSAFSIPHAFVQECYEILTKEPVQVTFMKRCLDLGRYEYDRDYPIEDVVVDFVAFCLAANLPPWLYVDATMYLRSAFCRIVSHYVPCKWDDTVMRILKKKMGTNSKDDGSSPPGTKHGGGDGRAYESQGP